MEMLEKKVAENILKIMNDRKMTQAAIAEMMGTSPSQLSRELKGEVGVSLSQIENLATALGMQDIDIFTYPDKYVKDERRDEKIDAVLQIKLKNSVKKKVLEFVFGEENIELLK